MEEKTKVGIVTHKINNTEYEFSLHKSILDIKEEWEAIVPDKLFFKSKYLSFAEANTPEGMHQRYGLFHLGGEPVGTLILQVKKIALGESLTVVEDDNQSLRSKIAKSVKSNIAKTISFNTLIVGNLFLTGQFSFYFKDQDKPFHEQFALIENSLEVVTKLLAQEGLKVGSVLMKDFYEYNAVSKSSITSNFSECKVQPNMVMSVREDWHNFEDYLSALKSKYRVRIKRALKKSNAIERRRLSLEELAQYESITHELYLQTALQANFNLFILPKDYFRQMQIGLGEQFKLVGYFLDGELIGYYTIIYDKDHVDAHFLGYNREKNATYQTYLNMLIDIVKDGIEHKASHIHFSRTALEIKSSIGAEPEEMVFYLRSQRQWQNKSLLPRMLGLLVPEEKWVPRSPFKD